MSDPHILQVSQYLTLINETLQLIPSQEVVVEGEVSDFRIAQQKWVSFDLKDEKEQAVLKCFMTTWQLKVPIENGMKVQVMGNPKVRERFGNFSLSVSQISPVGAGALQQAYELLKKKLEVEGLFNPSRKRSLVRFPSKIGVITSRDAAAYTDFIRILNNRWGGIEIVHAHVHVQGQYAVQEIVEAFELFNSLPEEERPDALVLTRGGGGLEDLHAFNSEEVARSVFQSFIPVVCGVGHERDESLCDYVADVRASTPSNAAELIVPSRDEVSYEIEAMARHGETRLKEILLSRNQIIDRTTRAIEFAIDREGDRLSMLAMRFEDRFNHWLPKIKDQLNVMERLLKGVDPKRILSRGYAIVTIGKKVLKNTKTLDIGQEIGIQLANGAVDAEVLRINGKGKVKLV